MIRVLLICLISLSLFADIKIAVAANMSFVMPKLIEAFKKHHPQQKVRMTIGSSGKLAAQILNGANYDIFMSADSYYPLKLYERGKTWSRPVVYALGELVVASRKPLKSLQDLQNLKHIAIANPKTAPYGKAAKEVLQKSRMWESLQKRLIFGESIAQTVSYVLHGADAAFIAKSALYAPKFPKLYTLQLDPKLYKPIRQSMVLIDPKGASFFTFMLSGEAARILQNFGYRMEW